ncbi:MAG: siderophore-interacting protein, partial [Phycicoccus sp.]
MTIGSPVLREHQPQFGMTVVAVADLGGGMRRVTFEAPELASFERCGPDEYVSLMMPRRGGDLVLPEAGASNVRAALARLPDGVRPDLRWYTLRSHDRATARVDVDIVTHGDAGPGSAWACRV